ncbi:hypothetical protein THAOC_01548, partial [Thalassiosira oceanica]
MTHKIVSVSGGTFSSRKFVIEFRRRYAVEDDRSRRSAAATAERASRCSSMFQSGVPYHKTGAFKTRRTFLPDDQYGVALDNLVKGCTDILLLSPDGQKVFTGKRCVQPQ